jgi:hypothetical protein
MLAELRASPLASALAFRATVDLTRMRSGLALMFAFESLLLFGWRYLNAETTTTHRVARRAAFCARRFAFRCCRH